MLLDYLTITARIGTFLTDINLYPHTGTHAAGQYLVDLFAPHSELRDGGWNGYHSSAALPGGGILAWGGNAGTVCVSLPAQSLSYFAGLFDIISALSLPGIRATRVDLAFDDRLGRVEWAYLDALVEAFVGDSSISCDEIITRLRRVDEFRTLSGPGRTYYFGAPSSDTRLRIYDKAAEQGLDGHWIRFEYQLRRGPARLIWDALVQDSGAAEICASYWRVARRPSDSSDSNSSRWPAAPWFAELIAGGSGRPSVAATETTLADSMRWISSQVAPSLAAIREALGPAAFSQWLHHLVAVAAEGLPEDRLNRFKI